MANEPRTPRLAVLIDADNASSRIAPRLFEEIAKIAIDPGTLEPPKCEVPGVGPEDRGAVDWLVANGFHRLGVGRKLGPIGRQALRMIINSAALVVDDEVAIRPLGDEINDGMKRAAIA